MLDRPRQSNFQQSGEQAVPRPQAKEVSARMCAASGGDAFPPETTDAQPQLEPKEPRHGDPLYA